MRRFLPYFLSGSDWRPVYRLAIKPENTVGCVFIIPRSRPSILSFYYFYIRSSYSFTLRASPFSAFAISRACHVARIAAKLFDRRETFRSIIRKKYVFGAKKKTSDNFQSFRARTVIFKRFVITILRVHDAYYRFTVFHLVRFGLYRDIFYAEFVVSGRVAIHV